MNMHSTPSTLHDALRSTAALVIINMSAWTPVRVDRDLSEDVAQARHGASRAFSVRKNLLSGADEAFKAITKLQASLRLWVYHRTVPFGSTVTRADRGPRLIANSQLIPFMQHIGKVKAEMQDLVDKAKEDYVASIATARRNLGAAFKEDDYPDADELDRLFGIDLEILPVPAKGGFAGLSADVSSQLDAVMEERMVAKAEAAHADLKERVTAIVGRIRKRIDDLNAAASAAEGTRQPALYASLFAEAGTVAELIEAFMPVLGGHEALESAADYLRSFAEIDKDDLRHPQVLSRETERLEQIETALDCFDV